MNLLTDMNAIFIVEVYVVRGGKEFYQSKQFNIQYYGGVNFVSLMQNDIKTTVGCDPTSPAPCMPLLLAAIIISLAAIGALHMQQITGMGGLAIVFLIVMGLFTYFMWVPLALMVVMCVAMLAIILNQTAVLSGR